MKGIGKLQKKNVVWMTVGVVGVLIAVLLFQGLSKRDDDSKQPSSVSSSEVEGEDHEDVVEAEEGNNEVSLWEDEETSTSQKNDSSKNQSSKKDSDKNDSSKNETADNEVSWDGEDSEGTDGSDESGNTGESEKEETNQEEEKEESEEEKSWTGYY